MEAFVVVFCFVVAIFSVVHLIGLMNMKFRDPEAYAKLAKDQRDHVDWAFKRKKR